MKKTDLETGLSQIFNLTHHLVGDGLIIYLIDDQKKNKEELKNFIRSANYLIEVLNEMQTGEITYPKFKLNKKMDEMKNYLAERPNLK
jgi:hypothetical protein